jgi:hypothetical protein
MVRRSKLIWSKKKDVEVIKKSSTKRTTDLRLHQGVISSKFSAKKEKYLDRCSGTRNVRFRTKTHGTVRYLTEKLTDKYQ